MPYLKHYYFYPQVLLFMLLLMGDPALILSNSG